LLDGKEKQTENTHIMLKLQDGKKYSEEGMTHQNISREQRAQRAFILRKQRMKKGYQTTKEKYRESLPPKKKAQTLEDDATAHQHQKYQESFPLEKKAKILEDDAVAHQKYQKTLPPKEKTRILEDNAPGSNLLNNNINKGRWTEEEHKIFMQEYEKYGNNCLLFAKVLSTQTPAQIKKHAECFFN
jgi:hypothetical protein